MTERLRDPILRERVRREMAGSGEEWDSTFRAAGSAETVLLVGFKTDALKPLTG